MDTSCLLSILTDTLQPKCLRNDIDPIETSGNVLDDVRIIPYEAAYRCAFRDLNLAWVAKYFTVEAKDREQLENPQERIIGKGGVILLA